MKSKHEFFKSSWRPALAWSYLVINLFDFAVAPILYNILQYLNPGQHIDAYTSVTLQGGGLFHLSMGAVLGIAAHGRTQEKLSGNDSKPVVKPVYNAPVVTSAPIPAQVVESGKFGKIVPPVEDPIL